MTTAQAWALVENRLLSSGGQFLALPPLPGLPGLMFDDNSDPNATQISSTTGGMRLFRREGSEIPISSPNGTLTHLVFTVELNLPGGTGNALIHEYPREIKRLFRPGQSFTSPDLGSSGLLTCSRTAVDYLGAPTDGRDLYRVNVVLVFDNYDYS